jgi:hypothetical protein
MAAMGTAPAPAQVTETSLHSFTSPPKVANPYSFTGGADGHYPNAGVILDSAGNLYETTYYGGTRAWA